MKGVRILIIVIVAVAIGSYLGKFVWNGVEYRAFIPNIIVPAESLGPLWLTNTLFTTLIVDVIILVLALLARRGIKKDGSVPGNTFARAWDALIDLLYRDYVQPTLGKRAKVVAPIAITAFIFIFISATFVLIPGVESIGKLKASQGGLKGWCVAQAGRVALVTGVPVDKKKGYADSCGRPAPAAYGAGDVRQGYSITPFLRRPTSDMNTALALALIAFFFVEIQGVRANGWHYFRRFFRIHPQEMGRTGMMNGFIGATLIVAGLFELIAELIRIVSFAFRLFGSMLAGTALVLAVGSLLPIFLPILALAFEFGIGMIQALVFLLLITVFTSLATAHDEH